MKRLIVTADDVGLHGGMTLGAVRAHRQGVVTACSVVASGRDFDHAAELLRDCPDLDVGVHLMLVEGRPLCPPSRVPSLVTRHGAFLPGHRTFVVRYAAGRIAVSEVEVELRAQIERVIGKGLAPCHLNSHQHLHALPRLFEIVARLAGEYRIPYVRVPDDRVPAGVPLARRAAVAALGRLARRARASATAPDVRGNDATIGIANAGHLGTARLLDLLQEVDGVTELVTHPGVDTPLIARAYDWRYDWDGETAALCDPAVAEAVRREGITLGGIRALAG